MRHGIALEINGKMRHPNEEPLRRALEAGVQLAFGSDIHHRSRVADAIDYVEQMVRRLELSQEELFNARTPKHLRRSSRNWASALGEALVGHAVIGTGAPRQRINAGNV